jgi:hypothetical protein
MVAVITPRSMVAVITPWSMARVITPRSMVGVNHACTWSITNKMIILLALKYIKQEMIFR